MFMWTTMSFFYLLSLNLISGNDHCRLWYKKIIDSTFECPYVEDLPNQGPLIWQSVDCESPGARYDYSFKSDKGGSKSVRSFIGKGQITFPSLHEQGRFNYGFKCGKCITPFHRDVKEVAGRFKDDLLEGPIRVTFHDGGFALGYAKDNHFIGALRFFNRLNEFQNITDTSSGQLLLARSFNVFINPKSTQNGRFFITSDFEDFFECSSNDQIYFFDCQQINQKDIKRTKSSSCESFLTSEESKMNSYRKFNLKFNWSSKIKRQIAPRTDSDECPIEEEWNSQRVRESIEQWRDHFFMKEDFHWTHINNDGPLNLTNPRILVTLHDFVNRKFLKSIFAITFKSGGKVLLKTKMVNGTIDAAVPQDSAKIPNWRDPIIIGVNSEKSGVSLKETENTFDDFDYVVIGHLKNGRLHGFVTINGIVPTDPEFVCPDYIGKGLGFIGNYRDGIPFGVCWREVTGGSWIYGEVDKHGHFTGDNIAYVYQDLKTALVGKFHKGLMVSGQEAEVVGEKCGENGMKLLKLTQPVGPYYHYEPPTNSSFGDQPLLGDPLDNRYVEVKKSEVFPLAGDGAHAKIDIPPNTIYLNSGGYLLTQEQLNVLKRVTAKEFMEKGLGSNTQEFIDTWKFRLYVQTCGLTFHIPSEFEPTSKYRGTMGRKVNNSFLPNSRNIDIENPRFGIITAFKSGPETIKAGQELLVNYGYSFKIGPPWYKKSFLDFMEAHPEEKVVIARIAQGKQRRELEDLYKASLV